MTRLPKRLKGHLYSPMGRATAGSVLTSLVGQSATAVSGILVARMLGVENRGYLALLILWPTILARLGGLGLPLALPYFIARDVHNAGVLSRLILRPAALQMTVIVCIHAAILAALLPGKPLPVKMAGVLTLAAGPLSLSLEYLLAVLQGQRRFAAFNVIRAAPATLYALLVLPLFLLGQSHLFSIASALTVALLISVAASAMVSRGELLAHGTKRVDGAKQELRHMLHFGLRGLLGSTSPIETFRLDQAVIGVFLNPAALGLYVVGLAFTNLPRMVAQSIGMVAYPQIASKREEGWSAMWPFVWSTIALAAVLVILLAITAPTLVPAIFGNQFVGAIAVTQILLIGSLFFAARRVLTDVSRGLGHPSAGSIAEATSWIWLVPSIVLLLPSLGIQGVAISLTGSAAFSFLVLCAILLWYRPKSRPGEREPGDGLEVAI